MRACAFAIATLACAAAAVAAPAGATITVETTQFIASPTSFNGFENIAASAAFTSPYFYAGNTPYAEGGITVQYIGSIPAQIWTQYQFEGTNGWYLNGGGDGYTRVTLTNGSTFSALQFLAGSGYSGSGSGLYYEALLDGSVVSSGTLVAVQPNGLRYSGLSGGGFDEVRLQANFSGAFNPEAFEAGSFDSFAALSGGVPEPATWAMLILGFGVVGGAMRRRQSARVTYA